MNLLGRAAIAAGVVVSMAMPVLPSQSQAEPPETLNTHHVMPIRGAGQPTGSLVTTGNGINYHNGPVLKDIVNTYIIWYGNWATQTSTSLLKQSILTDLLSNIGPSPYFNINTTYGDTVGNVSGTVQLNGQITDSYSQGKSGLSDKAIKNIVSNAIAGGRLPRDSNGLYFVFTSSDVSKTGFLTQYCGWHTHATLSGADIKYSFVGDPSGPKLGNCSWQSTGPNGDAGADAMASVIAHELEETATDPDLNAWYDNGGAENADKCAWTFGTPIGTTSNGAQYNMFLGARPFLIQRNWVNGGGGYCALA